MSKVELSKRAAAVLEWIKRQGDAATLPIRQQTLADLLGCSRRSIYRALKQLKEQGYLLETKKRQNRCKVYAVQRHCERSEAIQKNVTPSPGLPRRFAPRNDELCPQAKFHLDNCRNIFRYNFPEDFDWEKHFPEATHKIRHVEHQTKFWRLMFDNLYLIQERETGKPHSARTDNLDSTLFGVPYPNKPPASQIDYILQTRPAYRPYQPARVVRARLS